MMHIFDHKSILCRNPNVNECFWQKLGLKSYFGCNAIKVSTLNKLKERAQWVCQKTILSPFFIDPFCKKNVLINLLKFKMCRNCNARLCFSFLRVHKLYVLHLVHFVLHLPSTFLHFSRDLKYRSWV